MAIRARSLSFYGLCLGMTQRSKKEALHCCREAVGLADPRPELSLNLGRVAELAGRLCEAHRALRRGLARNPGHLGLERELKRMGSRRSPVLSLVDRAHPFNILLGRLRSSFGRTAAAETKRRNLYAAGT